MLLQRTRIQGRSGMPEDNGAAQHGYPPAPSPSIDVFISYASQDMAVAEAVCSALEGAGVACWIAPRNVTLGEFYAESIVHAIDSARVLVLVLSQSTGASQHVVREVERASSKRHPVVPFRIDLAPLPAGLEYFLNTAQWLDASGTGVERALPRLVDGVRNALAHPSAAVNMIPNPAASGRVRPRPTRALLALAILIVAAIGYVVVDKWWLSKRIVPVANTPLGPTATASLERSVAVLPFVDLSEKKDQQYFAEGLSEEITNQLAKVPELKVAARTSSSYVSSKNLPISEIGKELDVATVLEGSVRKSADSIRITAQLVRVRDGYHLWSNTYDGRLSDVFKTQDSIAGNVVRALEIRMLPSGFSPSVPAEHAEAHELLSQCQFLARTGGEGDWEDCTHRAVVLDPGYAQAWAEYSFSLQVFDPRAREAAKKALALAPDLADAHVALGRIYSFVDHDWTRADVELKQALALDRGENFYTLWWIGDLAYRLGRVDDAIRYYEQVIDLESRNWKAFCDMGDVYNSAGRLEEAEAAYRKALTLKPDSNSDAHYGLGWVAIKRRDGKAAVAEFKQVSDESQRLRGLSMAYFALHQKPESDRLLAALTAKYGCDPIGQCDPMSVSMVHVYRGENDAAFDWIAKAIKVKAPAVTYIKTDLYLNLASDPRYHAFLRQLNLPE
jgi:adenylate cyclase